MFLLTKESVPCSTIILGSQAAWLSRHAAEELRNYIQKISNVTLPIMDEALADRVVGNRIYIGLPSECSFIQKFAEFNLGILPEECNTENDCIAYAVQENTLVISGSNGRSVYYSVCHLLQTEFGVGFYWDRDVYEKKDSLALPDNLRRKERSQFKLRHSIGQWVYNFGAFLNQTERKEELDKLARNKINSYRLYSWNSYARKKTFIELGITGLEITEEDIVRRDCVRDTIRYAQELGMEVMVPMIPDETSTEFLKLYPNARYFGCEWVKDDKAEPHTVPCLYPEDPMYKTLIRTFVKVWVETYGPGCNFVCAPPNEHHISTDIDDFIEINMNFPKYTYEALQEVLPNAKLFYDGWGVRANTPPGIWTMPGVMQRFADSIPEEVIFLDLWPNREEFGSNYAEPMYRDENYRPLHKTHYVLEVLNEFGGDDHMHGNIAHHIEAAKEVKDPAKVEHSDGFGNCTELCGVSLHFFDLIFQLAWRPEQITVESFLVDSARRRYGNLSREIGLKAMQDLEQAVYGNRKSAHARYQKRCYLARAQRTPEPLQQSLEIVSYLDDFMSIMTALPDEQKTDAIGQDMYDVMRQYITEYFNLHIRCLFAVFLYRKSIENVGTAFEQQAAILEMLMAQLELLTKENTKMYVETIVRQFRGRPCDPDITTADCKTSTDFRAWMRDMGTTYIKSIPNLPDYASQDYHELICYYYHPRISACIETLREMLNDNGKTPAQVVDNILEQRYKVVEDHWIDEGYPVTDECEKEHPPLWKTAQSAWKKLNTLSLQEGLIAYADYEDKEMADVIAGESENSETEKARSWVSENPFASKKIDDIE